MITKTIINEIFPNTWPMLVLISVIAISLRVAYLIKNGKKFILHKEFLNLVFILYILCLYYAVTYQDINYGGINLIPFKEMFRYTFGSYKFKRNIVGNILLFVPYGFFSSYYLNNKKTSTNLILCFCATLCIETIQYYIGRVFDIDDIILNILGGFLGYLLFVALTAIRNRLPGFMKSDGFINFLVILIIIVCVLLSLNINLFGILGGK